MKIGFSKSTRTTEEQHALLSQFQGAGFDGLQLKINQYRDYLTDPPRFLDDWGSFPGVAAGLIVGGPLDDAGRRTLRSIFRFARAAGSERVVYWPAEPRQEAGSDAFAAFARTLSELGKEAQQAGTKLSLHHHHNQIVMTRDDLDRFFALVSDGSVGLTVDTAHLVKSGVMDIAGVIRDFRAVLDNIHMKDFAHGDWRVLGEGEIDFAPVFAAVREGAFTGWVCADEESGSELRQGMEACYRFLDAGLSRRVE